MSNKSIVTRVAPSPTGLFHIGTARVALFNYLFTRQNGGKMIFRVDDTDTERSKPEYTEDLLNSMTWLGLDYDEIYYQSKRTDIYRAKLDELMTADKIYWSQEKIEKEGDRDKVIRFRNPNTKIVFEDLIHGHIEFDTTELGDFVMAKDLDTPLYHFASVVDDHLLGVTHVIRGEDHISNTPRQILMLEALGGVRPTYAHLPIILAPDRTKLSKRKHGAIASVSEYQRLGYLPEAVINFVAMLGWSPQSSQEDADKNEEILSMADLLKKFDLLKTQKSGAILNIEKMDWLNREYLKKLSSDDFKNKVLEFLPANFKNKPEYQEEILNKILPLILERISRLGELTAMAEEGELDYFFIAPKPSKEILKTPEYLVEVSQLLADLPEADFTTEKIKAAIWDHATTKGRGQVLWPMRVALSGREKSPDPFTLAAILGKAETLNRLAYAEKL
ncbi:MAG: glutamate--tRNA ligase family protein [Candidatus Paceibacterota bacterium]|jgi:glutamyl-tRNA synthetase